VLPKRAGGSAGAAGARYRQRFHGRIAGVGSTSGVRVVIGHWTRSPFGEFADAMVQTADRHRVLLAPDQQVCDFVSQTYVFDDVRIEPFTVTRHGGDWRVDARSLTLRLRTGRRLPVGHLLRLVPAALATSPAWAAAVDPVARRLMPGVRTAGEARQGRREYYGALDLCRVVGLGGRFDGVDLGGLAPLQPPCDFGFSSAPRTPSVTRLVTTVVMDR
jgi:hypothetical protein